MICEKRDAKKQDDRDRDLTVPPDDGKSTLEEFWRFQLNRIRERAELQTGRASQAVDRLEED